MAYSITLSNGSVVPIDDGVILQTYSVPLVGQNSANYGDDIAAAFLRSLENFAFSVDPAANPNIPGSVLLEGQLWYNTTTDELNVRSAGGWNNLLTPAGDFTAIDSSISPSADSTHSLGATGFRWSKLWADDIQFGGDLIADATSTMTVSGAVTADGSSTVDLNGTNTLAGATMTDRLDLAAASGATASLRIASGTSTSTTTGDMWFTGSELKIRTSGGEQTVAFAGGGGTEVSSFNTRSGNVTSDVLDYSDPLLADGHLNVYPRKDAGSPAQTIESSAGAWTYNNTPVFANVAPFTVSNASAGTVTNLSAQKLNGQLASYYAVDADVVHTTGAESVAGTKTFSATINADAAAVSGEGLRIRGTSGTATTNQAYASFYESDNTTLIGRVGVTSNSSADFDVSAHTGNLKLWAQDTSATSQIASLTTSGMNIYTSTGTQLVEVATATSTTEDSGSLRFRDQGGNLRNAGFNETPNVPVEGGITISSTHIGKFLTRTANTATTLTLNTGLTYYPVGASFMVHNDAELNTLQVVEGTATLQWVDGSGSAPSTGDRTIAWNGVATVRYKGSGVFQIWGNGIT